MIEQQIQEAILQFRQQYGREPSTIRINPKDHTQLRREHALIKIIPFARLEQYAGLKVEIDSRQTEGVVEIL
jgi:hypothetical protein